MHVVECMQLKTGIEFCAGITATWYRHHAIIFIFIEFLIHLISVFLSYFSVLFIHIQ